MITPAQDKTAIKAILDTDPYIQGAGFVPENIKTTKYGTDTLNSNTQDFQMFIYNGTPENPNNRMQKGVVYKIAISGKRKSRLVVDNVSEQVIALLHDADLGRAHYLELLDPFIELESDPAIYIVEASFISYQTVYNKIKT